MRRITLVLAGFVSALALTGCSTSFTSIPAAPAGSSPLGAIQGNVHGGQQPISGAHVFVFAAGTGGYGTAQRR